MFDSLKRYYLLMEEKQSTGLGDDKLKITLGFG
jgi:hypothetical protein